MPLIIPDETLRAAGLNEHEALTEFACRLFDAGKLTLWASAKLVGMSRLDFEQELRLREIPIYKPTLEDLSDDLKALDGLGV